MTDLNTPTESILDNSSILTPTIGEVMASMRLARATRCGASLRMTRVAVA